MRYQIERNEEGRWTIVAYTADGRLGAKVLCSDTDQVMQVFFMLAGHSKLEDSRREDLLQEITQKVA